ncbi:ABC transporter permease [Fodinicurvata sediminis]|uniref:ABC transporter permease n=1 Tax=Fodinicurvata sediminis TaxID=1121832 RepID=UPI0003B3D396|nr:ABC transporter permease [Fodinicurvata sediminis]
MADSTADLKQRLRRTERRRRLGSLGLFAPSVIFLLIFFALPIALMLYRAVQNPEVANTFPETMAAIQQWDGEGMPEEAIVAQFATELRDAREERQLSAPGRRLDYEVVGYRGLLRATAFGLPDGEPEASWTDTLIEIDPRWEESKYWQALKENASPFTLDYVLTALDLEFAEDGSLQWVSDQQAIYLDLYERTLWMAFVITSAALLLGYPIAYLMTNSSRMVQGILLVLVLLPFWTSLLVRTASWMVLLSRTGPVNTLLVNLGLTDAPLELLYNRFGVYVGMIHILLPFMIMPLYAVMRGIPHSHMRAAASLGAPPLRAFRRVYLPQTMPGIAAGCLLVFILAIGFYITPALLGGNDDQMISYFIAYHTNETLNWGLAAALGVILLVMIFVLYAIFTRLTGTGRIQMGT